MVDCGQISAMCRALCDHLAGHCILNSNLIVEKFDANDLSTCFATNLDWKVAALALNVYLFKNLCLVYQNDQVICCLINTVTC